VGKTIVYDQGILEASSGNKQTCCEVNWRRSHITKATTCLIHCYAASLSVSERWKNERKGIIALDNTMTTVNTTPSGQKKPIYIYILISLLRDLWTRKNNLVTLRLVVMTTPLSSDNVYRRLSTWVTSSISDRPNGTLDVLTSQTKKELSMSSIAQSDVT